MPPPFLIFSPASVSIPLLQLLPEKYCYFKRVSSCVARHAMSDADEGGSGLDCVICMTPVPITCHAEDKMVSVTV